MIKTSSALIYRIIRTPKYYNFSYLKFIGQIKTAYNEYTKDYQTFDVIFDTGSSYLQLNSNLCTMPLCSMHTKYDSSRSSNYKEIASSIEISYGSGTVNGKQSIDEFLQEKIDIGIQQFIEIKNTDDSLFSDAKYDGIVGQALQGLVADDTNTITFWDHLLEKRENLYIMMYFLNRQKGKRNSQVCFGDLYSSMKYINYISLHNKKKKNKSGDTYDMQKMINWSNVISKSYWQIKIDNLLIGGLDILQCKNGCKAIIDTGSSLISGPSNDISKLKSVITVDPRCNGVEKLPDIT